jgi:putative hydrolase of the HAD superfamily
MSLLRFKALTLDVVGTLIDFERGMLDHLRQVAPTATVSDAHFLAAYREARASPLALYYPDDLGRVWMDLARKFGLPREAAAGFRASITHWPAYSDTVLALKRLKKHFKLIAATNAQRWALSCFELTLEMPFDWTVTPEDTQHEKPDPRYFLSLRNVLAQRGIRQVDTLHVGRSQFHDIRIAQALGWRTCWIERGTGRAVDKPARPDWHFTTLRELADAVDAEALQEQEGKGLPLFTGTSAFSWRHDSGTRLRV